MTKNIVSRFALVVGLSLATLTTLISGCGDDSATTCGDPDAPQPRDGSSGCTTTCTSQADCAALPGTVCTAPAVGQPGTCTTPSGATCSSLAPCPTGQTCDASGHCSGTINYCSGITCPSGDTCVVQGTTPVCNAPSCGTCPDSSYYCSNGACVKGTDPCTNVTCGSGQYCSGGTCYGGSTGCTSNSQCPSGYSCSNAVCVQNPTGCTSNSQCPSGYSCTNSVCTQNPTGCTSNSQCASNQTCTNGSCVNNGNNGTIAEARWIASSPAQDTDTWAASMNDPGSNGTYSISSTVQAYAADKVVVMCARLYGPSNAAQVTVGYGQWIDGLRQQLAAKHAGCNVNDTTCANNYAATSQALKDLAADVLAGDKSVQFDRGELSSSTPPLQDTDPVTASQFQLGCIVFSNQSFSAF